MNSPLHVAIDAQLLPNQGTGGIESVLTGLIKSLGQLDGDERYTIIGPADDTDWLEPFLGPNQKLVRGELGQRDRRSPFSVLGRGLRRAIAGVSNETTSFPYQSFFTGPQVPVSNSFYEHLGCDVIHFPLNHFAITSVPAVYNPHDLIHLHYPQFFSPTTIAWWESLHPTACRLAQIVVVGSNFIKHDVMRQYGTPADKIQVIPAFLPQTELTSDQSAKLPRKVVSPFALYPAMTWPKKNHLRLLQAVAKLRDENNLRITLVCAGKKTEHFAPIERALHELKLEDQVTFLGLVSKEELAALYQACNFVVLPSLYEANSIPMFEAWQSGKPVACSNVTGLPDQAGNGALLFDPFSIDAIASVLKTFWLNGDEQEKYRRLGQDRLKTYSTQSIAKHYRAVYRQIAKFPLSEEDASLLGLADFVEPAHTSIKPVLKVHKSVPA